MNIVNKLKAKITQRKLDRISPSMCALPWSHIFVNNSSEIHVCCMAEYYGEGATNDGQKIFAFEKDAIQTAFNSEYFKNIRRQMLSGKRPKECHRCFVDEDNGLKSYRLSQNQYHGGSILELPELAEVAPLKPRFLDIRLGNMCNLICRMCHPTASRKWTTEWNSLFENSLNEASIEKLKFDWFEGESFWQNISGFLPDIRKIHLAGGEPLMTKRSFDFLQQLIDRGYAGEIDLTYNTNFTVLPEKAFSLWKHFKSVRLMISIDGLGEVNSYIRYPAKWSEIEENFRRIKAYENESWFLPPTIVATVQIFNAYHLPLLLDYLAQHEVRLFPDFHLNILSEPSCYSLQALPKAMKNEVKSLWLQSLDGFKRGRWLSVNGFLRHYYLKRNISGVINFMFEEDRSDQLEEFKRRTQVLDKSREQSLFVTIPELKPLFTAQGSS